PATKSNLATHKGCEQQVDDRQTEADHRQNTQGGAAEPYKALSFGWIEDQPQTAQGYEAEADGQAAEQYDLCDIARTQAPATIEAVADGAAGKRCHPDIMPDRQGGERCKRRAAPGKRLARITHRQPIKAGETKIGAGGKCKRQDR